MNRALIAAVIAFTIGALTATAHAQSKRTTTDDIRTKIDFDDVQGLLAVQQVGGWLLYDFQGQNPIARELVNPSGETTRGWFYFIPDEGQPVAIVHKVDAGQFDRVPGRKVAYARGRQLDEALADVLKGAKRVAMEYSEKGAIPALSRVDAGTLERVRSAGVKVVSSAELVQFTKSVWGVDGRKAHYVAVHHLDAIREDALDYIASRVRAGKDVTEYDVQQRIVKAYRVRGLTGSPPIVAVNANAADPQYTPKKGKSAMIREGDLVLLDMWARTDDADRAIYAEISWVAYVGAEVPNRYERAFEAAAKARDETIDLIDSKVKRRRPVRGYEADQTARNVISKAGFADKFIHRTGHSLDSDVHGAGANLDDYETHDTRTLVRGSGFTVEPGIYVKGDFGVRAGVSVYVGKKGAEVTSDVQKTITPLLKK
jgi:Xaa-Pro aminopeptidase